MGDSDVLSWGHQVPGVTAEVSKTMLGGKEETGLPSSLGSSMDPLCSPLLAAPALSWDVLS